MKEYFVYSFKALKGNYIKLFFLTIICVISSIIGLIIPLISGNFINNLILKPSIEVIYDFCKLMILAYIMNFIFKYVQTILYVKIQISSSYSLNSKVLRKLQRVNILKLETNDTSYLNQRINNDVNSIIIYIINLVKDLIIQIINLIFSMLFLINIDFKISIVLLLVIVFYIVFYKLLRKKIQVIKNRVLEKKAKYYSRLQDQLYYVKFIKIYNFGNYISNYLSNEYTKLREILITDQKYTYLLSLGEQSAILVIQLLIYIIGGLKVITRELSIGMFTIVSQYFYKVIGSIKFFSSLYQQYLSSYVSYKRLLEIEQFMPDNTGDVILEDIKRIELDNVTFAYGEMKVIQNFTLKMNTGNVYAFVGMNGSGKTTLINLIVGLYTDYRGVIKYNSINQCETDLYKTRENCFSIVSQTPLLFNGTIKENLMMNKNISLNDIKYYLLEFNLISTEDEMDDFLDKNINELTTRMSGGEGQKINIIRELLRNKSVYILDEPTSSLDRKSKEVLKKIILEKKKNHIIVLISHDMEFLKGVPIEEIYIDKNSKN